MSTQAANEREIREIAIAANGGEATDEQLARLDELVRSDQQLANYAARVFDQQAALSWQGSLRGGAAMDGRPDEVLSAKPQAVREDGEYAKSPAGRFVKLNSSWTWPTIAVGIAFVLGALAGLTLLESSRNSALLDMVASAQPAYEARLTRSTACLWDSNSIGSRDVGSWLTSGESLHLLEGLAEFTLDWGQGGNATLSLEGPAAMMLTSQGMPTLRFGRMTATINASSRPFVLETPIGRLVVSEFGSIGASGFGIDGEIHVFDGEATLEPAWRTTTDEASVPLKIAAGDAIRVQEDENGELVITRHPADQEYFVAQLSMSADALVLPPGYAAAVKEAAPIAYWRFERDKWPMVPNEMGERFNCHVEGALGVTAYHGNHAVEFGVTDEGGDILCDDMLQDDFQDSYSIESWIKPSHYHVGAVISLVGDPSVPDGVVPHGFLLEMGGTGLVPTALHHPGRVRFLHRSPASNDSLLGTSCYSSDAYTLRKWQHVVAVKDANKMQLYINGVLASEGEDSSTMAPGMRLLLGRLYPSRRVRPFIGQLDELAIYNRALKPQEIKRHYHLVRPKAIEPSI
jgi:hypothetical protein